MTSLAELRAKVEARVQAELVPALFDRAIKVHEKRSWRDCDCDWCERKREWHAKLQFTPHYIPPSHGLSVSDRRKVWRYFKVQDARRELAEEEQRILS